MVGVPDRLAENAHNAPQAAFLPPGYMADDRETGVLLENIAYAIEDAFDLGRAAGRDEARPKKE